METYKDARVLIVDNDGLVCDVLGEIISSWGIKTEVMTKPKLVVDQLRNTFYNIVILDIVMPEKSGFDLIPEISKLCPDTKIIIMTGYADKENTIQALRLGVLDFLEKPIEMELLFHAVKRALDCQKTELELGRSVKELERSQIDLLTHKRRLEQVNELLLETNKALSVLAKNLERTWKESEKRIVLKIRSLIIPIAEKLQQDKTLGKYKAELGMLVGHIENLTSGLGNDAGIAACLSSTELRIASMIMSGLTSQEIANQLHISDSTVKTHRKNIRKKLNITHSKENLRAYLESRMREG